MITLFGYGSLMNKESLKQTIPNATNFRPAKLFGFIRVFNFPSPFRLSEIDGKPCAVLNIEKSEWNEYINGICFDINDKDLQKFMEREKGYELVKVNVEDYFSEKTFKANVFRALHFETTDFIFESKKQLEYLDLCITACKSIDQNFLDLFNSTTFIGNKTLKEIKFR